MNNFFLFPLALIIVETAKAHILNFMGPAFFVLCFLSLRYFIFGYGSLICYILGCFRLDFSILALFSLDLLRLGCFYFFFQIIRNLCKEPSKSSLSGFA